MLTASWRYSTLVRSSAILVSACWFCLTLASAARADAVDDYLRRQIRKRHIPGLSLAIVKDGRVVKAAGYGFANVEVRARATPRTVYQLASMSKQFAAAAMLLLVQDGKVALDAPISKYLDATPAAWKAITVRHLLSHTSGLPREGIETNDKNGLADFTEEEMWKSAIALPLQAAPGVRFAYSNLGYNLVAMIVEKVGGKPYGEFLQTRIFGPLGMRSTRINDLRAVLPDRACGYVWSQGHLRIAEQTSPTLYFGAGAIVSTVLDLAKWDAALYTSRILSAESRKEMIETTRLNSGRSSSYGFGWFVGDLQGHPRMSHDGLLAGFRTYIARFLNDHLTLILLTNQSSLSDPGGIANGVAREFLPGLTDYLTETETGVQGGSTLDVPRPHGKPATLASLTGRYEYSNNLMLTVETAKGRLLAHLPGSESDTYSALTDLVFVCPEEAARLTFERAPNGEVTSIEIQEVDGKRKIPRIGPLPHTLAAVTDPDPTRTAKILEALKAVSLGGAAVKAARGLTPGAQADFANPEADLASLQSIEYLTEWDVADRKLVRHGGTIRHVLFFRWKTPASTRYIQVYLTADGLLTDEDVVES